MTTAMYHRARDPHNVALVDLEEGFRMMSRIERMPAGEVEIGMRVAFGVREEGGEPVAVFVPVAEIGEGWACGAGLPSSGWPSRILGRLAPALLPWTL